MRVPQRSPAPVSLRLDRRAHSLSCLPPCESGTFSLSHQHLAQLRVRVGPGSSPGTWGACCVGLHRAPDRLGGVLECHATPVSLRLDRRVHSLSCLPWCKWCVPGLSYQALPSSLCEWAPDQVRGHGGGWCGSGRPPTVRLLAIQHENGLLGGEVWPPAGGAFLGAGGAGAIHHDGAFHV